MSVDQHDILHDDGDRRSWVLDLDHDYGELPLELGRPRKGLHAHGSVGAEQRGPGGWS
jgi:hypothetical protein